MGKIETVLGTDHVQHIDCDGINGIHNTLPYAAGIVEIALIVQREGSIIIIKGQILYDRCRCNHTHFKGRCIHRQRLDRRTGLQGCLRAVVSIEHHFFAYTAGHRDDITGTVIYHRNSGLKLLLASCFRNLIQIRIDGIHLFLNIHIQGGIDVVTATLDQVHAGCAGLIVPFHSLQLRQCLSHIIKNSFYKPGVNIIRVGFNKIAALRATVLAVYKQE